MPRASELCSPLWRRHRQERGRAIHPADRADMTHRPAATPECRMTDRARQSDNEPRTSSIDVILFSSGPQDRTFEPAHTVMGLDAASGPDHARSAAGGAERWPIDDRARAAQFEALVLPHLDDAYNVARWLTRNPQDADDVVQEAYLRGLRFFNAASSTNPRAWILTIVRNTFYTWLQNKRAEAVEPLSTASVDDPESQTEIEFWDPDQDTPEMALTRKTEDEAIRSLIEALPAPFREALILREMEDFSYQQIADITSVPIGTVMSRLARARALLQTAWRNYQAKERAV